MLHKTKLKIVFWGSLIAGVALCIGGIWVAALLVPGGILIAGAFGMFQSAYSLSQENLAEQHLQDHEMVEHRAVDTHPVLIEQNIGLFFIHADGAREPLEVEYPDRPRVPSPRPGRRLALE